MYQFLPDPISKQQRVEFELKIAIAFEYITFTARLFAFEQNNPEQHIKFHGELIFLKMNYRIIHGLIF